MHFRKRIESSNKSEEKLRKKEQGPIWEAVAVVSVIDMRCCTKVMGERERCHPPMLLASVKASPI